MTAEQYLEVTEGLPQGWFHHGEAILALLDTHRPKVCVELGSWRGASAIAMARLLRQWGGVLHCVDTWMGDVNGGIAAGRPSMLTECAANLITAGVAASIRLIPALTADAGTWWCGPIDFLYIDADHTFWSVREDLRIWAPHVRPGGVLCGDDYGNPTYPGVKQAWDEFERSASGWPLIRVPNPSADPAGMELVYGVRPEVRG